MPFVFLYFLQILEISVILQLHAIMECKDKVAKCLKTSLEVLTIHRHICYQKHTILKENFKV